METATPTLILNYILQSAAQDATAPSHGTVWHFPNAVRHERVSREPASSLSLAAAWRRRPLRLPAVHRLRPDAGGRTVARQGDRRSRKANSGTTKKLEELKKTLPAAGAQNPSKAACPTIGPRRLTGAASARRRWAAGSSPSRSSKPIRRPGGSPPRRAVSSRRPTTAPPSSINSTAKRPSPSAMSASRRRTRTSSGSAPAKTIRATPSPTATASTNRPTAAKPGRTWG